MRFLHVIALVLLLALSSTASADMFQFNFSTYNDPRITGTPMTDISGHGIFTASPTTDLPCFFSGFGFLAITSLSGGMTVAGQGSGSLSIVGGPCDNWVTSSGQLSAASPFNQLHLLFQGDTWTITHTSLANSYFEFQLLDDNNPNIWGPLTLDIKPIPTPEGASLPMILIGVGSCLTVARKKLLKRSPMK